MSIFINTGFRLPSPDIFEAQEFIRKMRAHFAHKYRLAYAEYFTAVAVERFDDAILAKAGLAEPPDELETSLPPIMYVYRKWLVLPEKQLETLASIIAPDISIVLHPHGGSLYGEVITTRRDVFDYVLAQPGIADFSYQNKTDQPDDISPDEWEERSKVWNDILACKLPRHISGFVATISSNDTISNFPENELVLSLIPPHDARAKNAAIRMTMRAHKIPAFQNAALRKVLDAPDSGYEEHLRVARETLPLDASGVVFPDR